MGDRAGEQKHDYRPQTSLPFPIFQENVSVKNKAYNISNWTSEYGERNNGYDY